MSPARVEIMVRRAERALGQAIKTGQERGEIRKSHGDFRGNRYTASSGLSVTQPTKSSPYDYASHAELHGQDDDGDHSDR